MKYTIENRSFGQCLKLGVLTDEEYDRLKPIIEHIGGHWRERFGCFVFKKGLNIEEKLEYCLKNGVQVTDQYRYQEETQFYPTPNKVAKRVVELAEIKKGQSVLEPSAGLGNLLDCIDVPCDILAVEPIVNNVVTLKHKGYPTEMTTFEEIYDSLPTFNRIIMNPPFSGQRDVKHVMMAYKKLKRHGVLVAIISENALWYKTQLSKDFKRFLERTHAYIEEVASNSFEESGTSIETVIVKFVKK